MKTNEHGAILDSNGYAPSILQDDLEHCYLCGRRDRKLDRHEVWSGPYRQKSKADGLWVMLCNHPCHEGKNGVQYNRKLRDLLCSYAQEIAMIEYGWTIDDFRKRYGKNWLEVEDAESDH